MAKRDNMEKFYVTTPIYYVNDKPHLGHAYTTVIADVFARYYRQKLGGDNVFFLTGTDEHGAKVAQAAKEHNQAPQDFVDTISNNYKETWQKLNISHDYFLRTTDVEHVKIVQNILQQLYNKGFIYQAAYKGMYCVGCEKYLTDSEMTDGKCPLHPTMTPVCQKEDNYFFKLSELSPQVLAKLETGAYSVLPAERKEEVLSRIKGGLEDISISRVGMDWGVPLPWDTSHTVYVWVDALFNYYSAVQMLPDKQMFWPPDLHLMAKDILWFHAVVWEALLLALDIELPKIVFAHGFFTIDGQKMSKSLGNVIDPMELVNTYGADGVRYVLLTAFMFGNDGDISLSKFNEKYNADLANGIGNLVSRVAKLCEQSEHDFSDVISSVKQQLDSDVEEAMSKYRPDEAVKVIWQQIQFLDKSINDDKPWTLSGDELIGVLTGYVPRLLNIAYMLEPFLPETAQKINSTFRSAKIIKPEPLFQRI